MQDWLQLPGPRPKLVINLSVGWEPGPSSADPCGRTTSAAESVYTALARASCAGAVVVTAAGNVTPKGASGAVCPALWANDVVDCAGQADALVPGSTVPVLYAAGGIDYAGAPISGHRTGSWPLLTALAHQGVAFPGQTPPPGLLMHSGTSVAAAVVSALVSRRWAGNLGLDAAGVVQALYDSGAEIRSGELAVTPDVKQTATPATSKVRCVTLRDVSTPDDCAQGGSNPLLVGAPATELGAFFQTPATGTMSTPTGAPAALPGGLVLPQPRTGCDLCTMWLTNPADPVVNLRFRAELPAGTSTVTLQLWSGATALGAPYYLSPTSAWVLNQSYAFHPGTLPSGTVTRATIGWYYLRQYDTQDLLLATGP